MANAAVIVEFLKCLAFKDITSTARGICPGAIFGFVEKSNKCRASSEPIPQIANVRQIPPGGRS